MFRFQSIALILASSLLGLTGLLGQTSTKFEIRGTSGAGLRKVLQRIEGDSHIMYDTDGSIFSFLDGNILSLNSATGASRASLGGNAIPDCGVLSLKSGVITSEITQFDVRCDGMLFNDSAGVQKIRFTPDLAGVVTQFSLYRGTGGNTTMVDFQATSTIGSFKIAKDAAGANGIVAAGDTLNIHFLNFYDSAGTSFVGTSLTGFGRGGATLLAMPSGAAPADGYVLGKVAGTGQQLGWILPPCGIGAQCQMSGLQHYNAGGAYLIDDWTVNTTGVNYYTNLTMAISGPATYSAVVSLGHDIGLGSGTLKLGNATYTTTLSGIGFSQVNGVAAFNGACATIVVFTNGVGTGCI